MKDEIIPGLGVKIKDDVGMSSSGLPYPSHYNGSDEFLPYLRKFNRIATAHSWTPPRCCQILPIYLRGSALAIYESMPEDEKLKWKTLVEGLAKRLRKVSNKEAARMKLAERKQELGESVEEYAQHLMNLVDFAYPEDSFVMDFSSLKLTDEQKTSLKDENEKMTRRFKEQTVIDSFKAGLLPETKGKMIFLNPPTSLAEAVAQARKIEELNNTLKEEIRKRMEEAQVREALEVNEVWGINGEKNEGERDERIDPNAGPYKDDGDEYYLDEDRYDYDEGQWLPESFDFENWGGEENHEQYDFFEDQGDQKWPIDEY